jgi:hypothetical protein
LRKRRKEENNYNLMLLDMINITFLYHVCALVLWSRGLFK